MKKILSILLALFVSGFSKAQNTGINTTSPTAKVDVNGNLRIRTLPLGSSSTDLVLVVDANGNVKKASLCDLQNAVYGDIKDSRQTADHCGWYLLNGRSINTLPANVQARATVLGMGSVLPNFTNRYARAKQGVENLAATGGNATITLSQANMPSYNMTFTTSTDGNHSHTIVDRNQYNSSAAGIVVGPYRNRQSNGPLNSRPDDAVTNTINIAGAHTHSFTLSSNGGRGSIPLSPAYIQYASFVYLGQ